MPSAGAGRGLDGVCLDELTQGDDVVGIELLEGEPALVALGHDVLGQHEGGAHDAAAGGQGEHHRRVAVGQGAKGLDPEKVVRRPSTTSSMHHSDVA